MALEGPNPGLSAADQESIDFSIAALEVCIAESRTQELRLRQIAPPLILIDDLPMQTPNRASQYALDAQTHTENLQDLRNRLVRWRDFQNSQPPVDQFLEGPRELDKPDETGL